MSPNSVAEQCPSTEPLSVAYHNSRPQNTPRLSKTLMSARRLIRIAVALAFIAGSGSLLMMQLQDPGLGEMPTTQPAAHQSQPTPVTGPPLVTVPKPDTGCPWASSHELLEPCGAAYDLRASTLNNAELRPTPEGIPTLRVLTIVVFNGGCIFAEYARLLKSLLLCASCHIEMHTVTDSASAKFIQLWADRVFAARGFTLTLHVMDRQAVETYLEQRRLRTTHSSGWVGLSKFFFPDILADLHGEILFVDTDMVFGADPCLWRSLPPLSPFGMVIRNGADDHICSCLLQLHLDRMREMNWTSTFLDSLEFWNHRLWLADQSLFHLAYQALKHRVVDFPRSWELSKCHNYEQYFVPQQERQVFMGIYHGNCQGGSDREALPAEWGHLHFFHQYPTCNVRFLRMMFPPWVPCRIRQVAFPANSKP